jgi:hypothetical protein
MIYSWQSSHLSFYVLVPALKREADLVDLSLQLVTEEQVLRDQRSRYRELQGRLHQYWSEYEEGHRTAQDLYYDIQLAVFDLIMHLQYVKLPLDD